MGRRLILDTTVLIAYDRGQIDRVPFDDDDLCVGAISVAEFRVGAELAETTARREARLAALKTLLEGIEVLGYSEMTAIEHARLLAHARRSGRARGQHDLIIAAHAAETGRTIVSGDAAARFDDLPGVSAITPA